ncbi:MAG TPA: hypothetical protein VNX15_05195, partial [Gemmatimonadales bacterium]|nr:hypothetical protein [Gemmatimonadales bacterium]
RITTVVRPVPVRRGPMVLKPESPAQPAQPSQPAQPLRPEQPGQPSQPSQPARPERPVEPGARPVPQTQPLLRARRPPPAPDPAPAVRQQAIQQHPGRPLEPQQVDNLRQGKPAGPMRDVEVPRDVRPQPRPAPRPAAPPPARPQPKKDKPN